MFIDAGRCTFTEMWPGEYPSRMPAGIPSGTPSDTCHNSTLETHLPMAAKSMSRDPKSSQSTGIVVYHWNHSGHQLLLSCGPKHPKPDTGGTLKTRSFFSMGCRVGHRVSAALVSGQSRGVSRWTCFMPVWAHDACAQSLVDRSSHAARARGDNKTQGQVFDSVMPGSSVAV